LPKTIVTYMKELFPTANLLFPVLIWLHLICTSNVLSKVPTHRRTVLMYSRNCTVLQLYPYSTVYCTYSWSKECIIVGSYSGYNILRRKELRVSEPVHVRGRTCVHSARDLHFLPLSRLHVVWAWWLNDRSVKHVQVCLKIINNRCLFFFSLQPLNRGFLFAIG
jgi:hypothetical protein